MTGCLALLEEPPVVVRHETDGKDCATCLYRSEVDRHECNQCAVEWNASNYHDHNGHVSVDWVKGLS